MSLNESVNISVVIIALTSIFSLMYSIYNNKRTLGAMFSCYIYFKEFQLNFLTLMEGLVTLMHLFFSIVLFKLSTPATSHFGE